MAQSVAYILVKSTNQVYHFTGVTSVKHDITLKIEEKTDSTEEAGLINGAKNNPDKVTLSVIETDAAHSAAGWAERMLDILFSIKRNRLLCRVVTAHHTYDNMLLSSVDADQDEIIQDGWSGELAFTECMSISQQAATKVDDNASKITNTGSAAPSVRVSGDVMASATRAAEEAAAAARQKSSGSIIPYVVSVANGSSLGQAISSGSINPNAVRALGSTV